MVQEERKVITIGGIEMHIALGKTYQEWEEKYGADSFCDFCLEDFINGEIEADNSITIYLNDKMFA